MTRLATVSLSAALGLVAASAAAQPPAKPEAPAKAEAPKAEAPKAEGGGAAGVVGPPQVAWKDMTKEQKGKFMKAAVLPKMKANFQAYDAETYKKFDCRTCHGKD